VSAERCSEEEEGMSRGSAGTRDMSDILFQCPACSKRLAVSTLGIGKVFPCPDCQERVPAPEPALHFKCPACGYRLCAATELIGTLLMCPDCSVEIQVPTQTSNDAIDVTRIVQ
jgi:predicted RNA-binding Zn-ribbon protein involved in translation (DUF1610 family)